MEALPWVLEAGSISIEVKFDSGGREPYRFQAW